MIGHEVVAAGAVTLRPWQPADASFVYDAAQDPELVRWLDRPHPFRAADAVELLRRSEAGRAAGTEALFAVTATDTGELLGAAGVGDIDRAAGRAVVGCWVAAEARGRGVAAAALVAVATWAGTALGVREVWVAVDPANAAGWRAAERAGFRVTEAAASTSASSGRLVLSRPTDPGPASRG